MEAPSSKRSTLFSPAFVEHEIVPKVGRYLKGYLLAEGVHTAVVF